VLSWIGFAARHRFRFGFLRASSSVHVPRELRDAVATAPAARFAFDREGRDAEVREGVGVVSHFQALSGMGEAAIENHSPQEATI
jgi:hypothetical protein